MTKSKVVITRITRVGDRIRVTTILLCFGFLQVRSLLEHVVGDDAAVGLAHDEFLSIVLLSAGG